jgi:hypothetical protein
MPGALCGIRMSMPVPRPTFIPWALELTLYFKGLVGGGRMQLRSRPSVPSGDQSAAGVGVPPDIRDQRLRGLWEYWSSKRVGMALPGRAAISPLEMRAWLGNLLLMDVVDGGRDFRYRLHGTQLVQLFGADLTGKLVSALAVRDVERLLAEGRTVVASRSWHYTEETVVAEKQHVGISKLILPLAADGHDVDMMIVGIYRRR